MFSLLYMTKNTVFYVSFCITLALLILWSPDYSIIYKVENAC
jgi:hypothetical protein